MVFIQYSINYYTSKAMYNNSLIFKTIENDAIQSELHITSVFEKINTELDALRKQSDIGTISFGKEFENSLKADTKALTNFMNERDKLS